MAQQDKAEWQESVKRSPSGALVTVRKTDGSRVGYLMPRKSLIERAAEDRKRSQSR